MVFQRGDSTAVVFWSNSSRGGRLLKTKIPYSAIQPLHKPLSELHTLGYDQYCVSRKPFAVVTSRHERPMRILSLCLSKAPAISVCLAHLSHAPLYYLLYVPVDIRRRYAWCPGLGTDEEQVTTWNVGSLFRRLYAPCAIQ